MATLERLEVLQVTWTAAGDRRAYFAEAYGAMTTAMLSGVTSGGFADDVWVGRLLDRFADYYFDAVEAFDAVDHFDPPRTCPKVWLDAFESCRRDDLSRLQVVLLGINAHINHDLPLALADVLDDWDELDEASRAGRLSDHEQVNTVIERSTDLVQDAVVNRAAPLLAIADRLLGPIDEAVFNHVVSCWREHGWEDAQRLVAAEDPEAREVVRADIEERARRWAHLIRLA
jgi:hypothetical protein